MITKSTKTLKNIGVFLFFLVVFNQTIYAQNSNAICNTYTPLNAAGFSNLTVTSSQSFGSDEFSPKANIIDANLNNVASWSYLIGGGAFIEVKDNNAINTQRFTAGTYAGFVVDNNTLLNLLGSVNIKTYLGTTEQDNVSGSGLVAINLLSGKGRLGFTTTKDFDRIRLTFSGLGVAGSTSVFYAEVKKFCAGPSPVCNTMTDLSSPAYPTQISDANTGFTGISVGTLANRENIISSSATDFASLNLPVGILASGSVSVKDNVTEYPAGYFAGFDIANPTLLGVNILNNVFITTYLNGVLRETKTANNLAIGVPLLPGANKQTLGFVSTLSFNEIQFTINQTVAVNVGTTNIYAASIERFCLGPVMVCNTETKITTPTHPVLIEAGNTGISGTACVGCTVLNAENIIDTNSTNFATINLTAGALANGSVAVKNILTTYTAGMFAGFDIENPNLATVNVLDNILISLLNNGAVVQTGTGLNQLITVNSSIILNTPRSIVGIVSNVPFDEVKFTVINTASVDVGTINIYSVNVQKPCSGPMGCNSTYLLTTPEFPVVVEGTRTGVNTIACVACGIENPNNVINSNTSDFARINLNVSGISSGSIAVRNQMDVYPAGTTAGFVVRDPNNFLEVNLFNAITIATYLNGVQQESKNGGQLLKLDAIILSVGSNPQVINVGFNTTKPWNEVRITYTNVLGAIAYLDVYGAYLNTSNVPYGTAGFDCNYSHPDVNVTLRDIPVFGNVKTNDKVLPGTSYGSPVLVLGFTNPTPTFPLVNSDGSYQFNASLPGMYRYNVSVCSGANCRTEMLTITVLDPLIMSNNAPVVNTDIAFTKMNEPVTIKSLANDEPGSIRNILLPGSVVLTDLNDTTRGNTINGGTAVVDPVTGNITYTAATDFTGTDTIKYTVCDNQTPQKCGSGFQVITVLPQVIPNITLASEDYISTTANASVAGNVAANDNDPEGNTQLVLPQNTTIAGKGNLVLNSDGSYIFIPSFGFSGPVDFVYTTCDNGNPQACADATLHILVKVGIADLTPSTRISNGTFIEANNTARDFVLEINEILNFATDNASAPIQVRIFKSDNFSYSFNPNGLTASIPSITAVNNNDWELITNNSSVMIFQLKPGKNITGLTSSKINISMRVLSGAAIGTENQTVGIINGSGMENNTINNAVVRILNIQN